MFKDISLWFSHSSSLSSSSWSSLAAAISSILQVFCEYPDLAITELWLQPTMNLALQCKTASKDSLWHVRIKLASNKTGGTGITTRVFLVKGSSSTCLAGLAVGHGNRSERWLSKEQRHKEHCDEACECFRARPLTQFVAVSVEIVWYYRPAEETLNDAMVWIMLFSRDISVILLPSETVGLYGTDQT